MKERNLTTKDLAGTGKDVVGRAPGDPVPDVPPASPHETAVAIADEAPPRDTRTAAASPLFPEKDAEGFRSRWNDIQAAFVDEPRRAVQDADALVADVMQRLAETFANERATLEHQWDRGDNVTTEDLRIALQRYRSFFSRLLSI